MTVTSVKLLDETGSYVPSHYFDLEQKPQLVLGMSGYMKYLTQGSLQTRMRYRLVNVATGRDCVYEQHQQSEHSAQQ